MNFGDDSVAKKMEVYRPSFDDKQDIKNESLKSRENLFKRPVLSERVDKIEMGIEEYFDKIENLAQQNMEEARVVAEILIEKAMYYYRSVAGLPSEESKMIMDMAHNYFDSYFANLQADLKIAEKQLEIEIEASKELANAATREEFSILLSKSQNRELIYIRNTHKRISELYHLAEQKIKGLLGEAFEKSRENIYLSAA